MLTATNTLIDGLSAQALETVPVESFEPFHYTVPTETGSNTRLVIVTDTVGHDEPEVRNLRTGVIRSCRPGMGGGVRYGWSHDESPFVHWGAELNPVPVNGAYYRTVRISGNPSLLLRYNDEAHRGDRGTAVCPWTILKSNDNTWGVPDDGLLDLDRPYYRVVFTEETAADEVRNPGDLGMDEANPTLVGGKEYVGWLKDTPSDGQWFFVIHDGVPVHVGASPSYAPTAITHGSLRELTNLDEMHWRELKSEDRTTPDEEHQTRLRTNIGRIVSDEEGKWSSFRDALVEKAEDSSWCGEFDGIIEKLGMDTRSQDYCIDLRVSATLTNNNTTGVFDERMASELGVESGYLTVNEARLEVSIDVSTTRSGSSGSDAAESLDSSEVEDLVDEQIPYGWSVDVDDWEVISTERAD